jgi:hypothetical protein
MNLGVLYLKTNNGCLQIGMDGWMDEWMAGWLGGWIGGWTD